jgi:hypothetical protein
MTDRSIVADVLKKCSLTDIAIEIIECGSSGVIEKLRALEPISISQLLEEVSDRTGITFSNREQFLAYIVTPAAGFQFGEHEILLCALKVKAAERRFRAGRASE